MYTSLFTFFKWFNDDLISLPSTILFFGAAIILTLKTGFMQIRYFPKFIKLIVDGVKKTKTPKSETLNESINPFHALFTALATSIGMGNIVGPTTAIVAGGPGALFWMLIYMFFASVTKFTEVTFALHTRTKNAEGQINGGPMVYLEKVSVFFAYWYGIIMTILFVGWSSVQSNNLANIYAIESIPHWTIGLSLALFTGFILSGGAQRVGDFASKLVPIMFFLYVSFALVILFGDITALKNAFILIGQSIFTPAAPLGGFFGASILQAMRFGVFRGIYISESGIGTASIPHAMSDAKIPTDQGILAMGSTVADMTLSILSGLLVLVTGAWAQGALGESSTLIYKIFKMYSPMVGQIVLLISVTLFVLTTVIGNSFNGMRSFAFFTKNEFLNKIYILFTVICIFIGSLMPVPLVWEMMDTMLAFAAIPNILGLLYLAFKYPNVLKVPKS